MFPVSETGNVSSKRNLKVVLRFKIHSSFIYFGDFEITVKNKTKQNKIQNKTNKQQLKPNNNSNKNQTTTTTKTKSKICIFYHFFFLFFFLKRIEVVWQQTIFPYMTHIWSNTIHCWVKLIFHKNGCTRY